MKFKFFLLTAAAVSAALSASAEAIPVTFFPIGNRCDISIVGTNEEGVFEYISEGVDNRPTDADGNPTGDYGNTIIGINKFEVPAPGSYVLAFDYKVNTDIFTYMGVRRTWDDGRSICTEMELQEAFEPTDEWLTYYVPFINTTEWDWISESWLPNPDGGTMYEPYMILAQNNSNGKPGPFSLLIKNGRVMTNEEATAEINASSAEQPEGLFAFHGLREEFDEFTNSSYFTFDDLEKNEDGTFAQQAIIGTNTRVLPINPKNNHFTFEYSVMDGFTMHVMGVKEGTDWFAQPVGDIVLEGSGDDAGFENTFKTAQIDLSNLINTEGFGQGFGSKSYLWIQCYDSPAGNFIYVKNPRWAPANGDTAIEVIEAENGEAVYYNLQGIRVNNPATGNLYIKVQNGKSTKVIAE
ncbi:MAG: hypothetical protein K2G41_03730 [Duncaniella sp.]|uniref:hypothetical protein n=1 Tax=Duncaniella sp. TaxID=2518496 RepID=UPI0023CA33F3|nr:hypothetical protein [Duncaniella sp.]MDE6089792.1 hypothetical protein [Duncaniella sp.]